MPPSPSERSWDRFRAFLQATRGSTSPNPRDSQETRTAYAYEISEIVVLPGTLGGKDNLTTNPSGETSIYGRILLKYARDVNGVLLVGHGLNLATTQNLRD